MHFHWLTAFFRKPPPDGKVVYFDLHYIDRISSNSFGRQTYLLFMLFRENGFATCVKPNVRFMAGLSELKYARLIYDFDPIFTFTRPDSAEVMFVTDLVRSQLPRTVLLDYREKPDAETLKEGAFFPYVMHPLIYHNRMHKKVGELRKLSTSMRLFFGGNLDPNRYDSPKLQRDYGILSRLQVIGTLRDRLHGEQLRGIQDEQGLSKALQSEHRGFSWIADPALKIPPGQWLPLLARTDFFLACPGVSKPMCHNIVEAMSVGAVPILEYPEYFHPPLVDGENCLVFKGKEDLVTTVNKAFGLDEQVIRKLSLGAVTYYENHLSTEAFGKKIAQLGEGGKIIFLGQKIPETL